MIATIKAPYFSLKYCRREEFEFENREEFMEHPKHRRSLFSMMIMVLLIALAVPAAAFGQGRGHGRGHGRGGIFSNPNWKCGKFVNCHDARNGRVDGRGPRGARVRNIILRNRIRHRNRHFDNNDFVLRNVRRNRNRNFDNNDFFRRGRGRHGKHE